MRTFDITVGIDIRIVAPDEFTEQLREDAISPDASAFIKKAQEMFPEDDDEFTLHVLKHGLRRNVRLELQNLLVQSGLGGTLAPATAYVRDVSPPVGQEPVSPAVVNATIA